ncbi:MAG: MASE1 domain-containing protein, partial [Silanimonas lenta]
LYHGAPLAGIGPWALAFLPILGYMAVVALARWWTRLAEPDAPARMGLLLGACLLSSLLVSPVLVLNAGSTVLDSELGARRLLDFALGDYFALMVLVPFACALRAGRLGELARRQRLLELLLGLLVAIALLRLGQAQPALLPSLQLLAFVPLMLVAFRHGWVGAATALAGLGLAIAYGLTGPEVAAELHARSAVLGSAALMLGAAASQLDSLRDQCWQVQDGLERVLRRLQPPAIDQRPLAELLAHGPLWEWAQEAGARWQAGVAPAAQTLPARWKALLYRIAQAGLQQGLAAGGRDFRLRLETRPLAGRYAVELALDIEAPAGLAANDPIEAIRDRVTAAGGQYTARREDGCWQHRARFEIQSL